MDIKDNLTKFLESKSLEELEEIQRMLGDGTFLDNDEDTGLSESRRRVLINEFYKSFSIEKGSYLFRSRVLTLGRKNNKERYKK